MNAAANFCSPIKILPQFFAVGGDFFTLPEREEERGREREGGREGDGE